MTLNKVEEGASIALKQVGSKIPWGKVITGLAGAYGTVYQIDKRNKPGSGTKPGGVWDSLPSDTGKKALDPVDEYTSKDVIRMRKNREKARKAKNKEKLRKTIEDLYGPIPEHVNWMKDIIEDAPPGAKYERMVKHIKKSYKKDGKLTKDEKSIAYATAWKNYNKNKLA